MEMLPYNSTTFFIRLENLADDLFDTYYNYYEKKEGEEDVDIPEEDKPEEQAIPKYLNLDELLPILVQKHLGTIVGVQMHMEETSLTGN